MQGTVGGREDTGGNEVGRRGGKKRREMFLLHFIQEYKADGRGGDAAQVNNGF